MKRKRLKYPKTKKVDVVDDYHGTKVADPYRWLEVMDSKETKAWVKSQNIISAKYLKDLPGREKIKARLRELWKYTRFTLPQKEGDRYYFWENKGLKNQFVLYMQKKPDSKPEVVLDPNEFSADGTVAVLETHFTKDGKLLAYTVSHGGRDRQEIRILNVDTGEHYNEVLKNCLFTGVGWKHNNDGFYYSRYPESGPLLHNRVYWHKLGTKQSDDILIYERPDFKELTFYPIMTKNGKILLLHAWFGSQWSNRIYYLRIEDDKTIIPLIEEDDGLYYYINSDDTIIYFSTTLDAPRWRIIAVDMNKPERENWKEIVPEQADTKHKAAMINNQFVIAYIRDAYHKLKIYDKNGKFQKDIPLPTLGSIADLSGNREDSEMLFSFVSFVHPQICYRYDFETAQLSMIRKAEIGFEASQYETKQAFCTSSDGTRVPMFIVHEKDIKLDGRNPLRLYGYGGFNISRIPFFAEAILPWLELGGVFVVPNLRGGGEYGDEWHRAGMLEKKQNVFDDLIACAEWLIENRYTCTEKLSIEGGSNGGLLVGACLVQRPELFGAVICRVPVLDMLRHHEFTVGHYCVYEYGNAEENPEHFKFMFAYSPLHNVKEGIDYPPTLITTAENDERAVPLHAYKFTATLQEKYKGNNPILLRVTSKAGHGIGKPMPKVIEEQVDQNAFLIDALNIDIEKIKF